MATSAKLKERRLLHKMEIHINGLGKYSFSIIIVAVVIGITICFLSTQHYNSTISLEKEKIEVTSTYSNLTQNNIDM